MRHLNYNHLLYFWETARRGGITQASEALHITPQTISGQIKLLEEAIGEPLFQKVGRRLELTSVGKFTQEYADEIFTLGAELAASVKSQKVAGFLKLNVGVDQSLPKLITCQVTTPAYEHDDSVCINFMEGNLEQLLAELSIHNIDLVLSNQPMPSGLAVKAYSHYLGESTLSFFATEKVRKKLAGRFPDCLHEAPLLLPRETNPLRTELEDWFGTLKISPAVVGEYDDSGLMKAFGWASAGVFTGPTAISKEIQAMYRVKQIGTVDELTERYYAISPERKIKHPAVIEICEHAHKHIFMS